VLTALSNIATAVGVAVAAYQLLNSRRQATTSFEDTLNAQYRKVIEPLPLGALFGEPLKEDLSGLLPHFYKNGVRTHFSRTKNMLEPLHIEFGGRIYICISAV
jgi:hypothetical protein